MAHDEAYLLAEKMIEEALHTGAMELSLSNLGLKEIPESIGHLTTLKNFTLAAMPSTATITNMLRLQKKHASQTTRIIMQLNKINTIGSFR